MSNTITISGTYKNNMKVSYGVHKPTNANEMTAAISYKELEEKFKEMVEDIGTKKIKKVTVSHHLSDAFGKVKKTESTLKNLNQINTIVIVNTNKALLARF